MPHPRPEAQGGVRPGSGEASACVLRQQSFGARVLPIRDAMPSRIDSHSAHMARSRGRRLQACVGGSNVELSPSCSAPWSCRSSCPGMVSLIGFEVPIPRDMRAVKNAPSQFGERLQSLHHRLAELSPADYRMSIESVLLHSYLAQPRSKLICATRN